MELQHLDEKFPQLVWLNICYGHLELVAKIKHTESPYVCGTTNLKTKIMIPWKFQHLQQSCIYIRYQSLHVHLGNGNDYKYCIVRITTQSFNYVFTLMQYLILSVKSASYIFVVSCYTDMYSERGFL